MGEKTDQAKGRAKEAVGAITDNDDIKKEGRGDRLAGEAREKLGDAKKKVGKLIDKVRDAVRGK